MSAIIDKTQSKQFDEDIVLVERFLSGDEGAFESLYARYYDKVFSIAKGILFDSEESADAVQEIFTLVYRNLRRFDQRSKFSTWLFRVAVNRSIQEARKHKHKPRQVELHDAIPEENSNSEEGDPRVEIALAELNPTDRALIVLFYWEELSLQEIAESIGCNPNAAKTRLYRARERFKQVYEAVQL